VHLAEFTEARRDGVNLVGNCSPSIAQRRRVLVEELETEIADVHPQVDTVPTGPKNLARFHRRS